MIEAAKAHAAVSVMANTTNVAEGSAETAEKNSSDSGCIGITDASVSETLKKRNVKSR